MANRPVALWIDIERAELEALHGAKESLARGQIKVIYLEAFAENYQSITEFLMPYGFHEVACANVHQTANADGTIQVHRFDAILVKE
jgi:hypothetical protein